MSARTRRLTAPKVNYTVPGMSLVAQRSWDDYSIGRDDAIDHLGTLDVAYAGVIEAHRDARQARR